MEGLIQTPVMLAVLSRAGRQRNQEEHDEAQVIVSNKEM